VSGGWEKGDVHWWHCPSDFLFNRTKVPNTVGPKSVRSWSVSGTTYLRCESDLPDILITDMAGSSNNGRHVGHSGR